MKNFIQSKFNALYVFVIFIIGYSGCINTDYMNIFRPEFQQHSDSKIINPIFSNNKFQTFQLPFNKKKIDLSIEQSVMLALNNNKELQIQQLQPVISGTFEQIERGVYDTELFINAEYQKIRESQMSNSNEEQEVNDEKEAAVSLGIRQLLPSGTKIEMSVEKEQNKSNNDPKSHKATIGLSITQSLLKGYGSKVNLASIKIAELDSSATKYQLLEFTQTLVADIEITYWEYVLAKQKIKIFEQSLKIAKKQRDEIEQQISIGILPKNEAAAARTEVALREEALIEANSIMENRRLKFLRLIAVDPEKHFDMQIIPISKPDIKPEPINDLKERLELAEKLRPDLNEARLRLKQKRLETTITRNGILPKLDMFIILGHSGYADSFSNSFKNFDNSNYDYTLGMQLNHYIGNRAAINKDYGSQLNREQASKAIANLKRIVHFDVRSAVNDLEHARKQISATRITLMFQKQTAKAEKDRFKVGSSTALMVSQAYRDLLSARNAEIEAIINYRIALIKLYIAEGSLLERRGLKIHF